MLTACFLLCAWVLKKLSRKKKTPLVRRSAWTWLVSICMIWIGSYIGMGINASLRSP